MTFIIDDARSACLCDVGGGDYSLVTAVTPDGTCVLVLAHQPDIGNPAAMVDASCPDAPFDQLGPLPSEVLDDISDSVAAYFRRNARRCGRRTKSGTVCRKRVSQPGGACEWHKSATV